MRPRIFVSAVTRELKEARDLVAKTLTFLRCQPDWKDIFGFETGDIREMLKKKIDACDAVVQLVGHAYGAEPTPGPNPGDRASYTHFEARYAHQTGKKVWYLLTTESFPAGRYDEEHEKRVKAQTAYRLDIESSEHSYETVATFPELELTVLRMLHALDALRPNSDRWIHDDATGPTKPTQPATPPSYPPVPQEQLEPVMRAALAQPVAPPTQTTSADTEQDKEAVEQRVYAQLGAKLGVDAEQLRTHLTAFAKQLAAAPEEPLLTRARAAQTAKDWPNAELLAVQAAHEAEQVNPPRPSDARDAWVIAGWACREQHRYPEALGHFRHADRFTDRDREPLDWARVQYAIAYLLDDNGDYAGAERTLHPALAICAQTLGPEHEDTLATRNLLANTLNAQGKYAEAEAEHRAVLALRERVLGPEHPSTLSSRNNLANALNAQGKYPEAETEHRAVLAISERVLGPEHPHTLSSRNNLANALDSQGKHSEAEAEHRAVFALSERVLGPEHPDTLSSRNNLAIVLRSQGKYAEAEAEHRARIALEERVLGPEHPDTLSSRKNLANVLYSQGKLADAEAENRARIAIEERVLGLDHPDLFQSCFNLALCLEDQDRKEEALEFMRRAEDGWRRVLRADHPYTRGAERVRKRIEAALKEKRTK